MKKLLLSLLALSSISAIAAVKDVGVIGPNGEVLLYYRDGNNIIVKACEPNTILGMLPAQARSNCQGRSNKVPVETFKQSLRNLVPTDLLNALKPLTPEEVEAYSKDGLKSEQVEAILIELEKINNFITVYGAENANLVRKDELLKALSSHETRISAIKKIKDEVEKTVNLISDQAKLTLAKSSVDKDQFIYTVLKQYDPNQKFPCGLDGSVDERIKDCSLLPTSSRAGFVLVTRLKNFKEIHKELSSGLLWSDSLPNDMDFGSASVVCNSILKEFAGISDVTWRLPSIKEYREAEKNGIRKAFPNMQGWFWSSTVDRYETDHAWQFVGDNGDTQTFFKVFDADVRCVAPTWSR